MFRVSFVVLAIASAFALNGCSQCSSQNQETAAPAEMEAPAETAPVEAADGAEVAPVEGAEMPAATPEAASAD
jgi:PBP1b-binding outer membrane lipoprotein LpoB